MSVLAVVIFEEDQRSVGYVQSLRALHDQGRVSLYAIATVGRDAGGVSPLLSVSRDEAIAAPAIGAAMGALLSLLQGPLRAAALSVPLSLIGAMRELDDMGVDATFLEQVSRDLPVGGATVLSEVEELQPLSIDTLAPEHGGRVFRQRLAAAFTERRLVAEITALRQELGRMRARNRQEQPDSVAGAASRAKGIELASAVRRAKMLAASLRREAEAKVKTMQLQAGRLEDGPRQAVLRRAAVVQARLERRLQALERAAEVTDSPAAARGRGSLNPSARLEDS